MNPPVLQFVRRGERVSLSNVPPSRTLLELLREDLACTAAKEGCGEGDCGACTVVIAQARGGRLVYQAINACIRLAHSVHGMALWTAGDLALPDGRLHPCQQALVDHHASQCGFCTPGFAMSLFGLYQRQVARGQAVTREQAVAALSGNLCRCTGYRPILDAAQQMDRAPGAPIDEAALLQKLEHINATPCGLNADLTLNTAYAAPTTLPGLLQARAQHPQAQLVAGCTDVGLWVTQQQRRFEQVLDLTRVEALQQIESTDTHLRIGAAVSLERAFAALVAERAQLQHLAQRFAGLPVRHSGTLGGNVANGSPIGDSMPMLIALGADVVLASVRGTRRLALERLYTGYRQTALAPDEVLTHILVPRPAPQERLRVYKVSKRQEDDISAVCLAVALWVQGGAIVRAGVGVGGVAATPVRATRTEAALAGQPLAQATLARAGALLQGEFTPLSDLRASADYRRALLGGLMQRLWLELSGPGDATLEALA